MMGERDNGGSRRIAGRPDGVPLGRAFLIGPGMANEPLREAIDVVARVHGDGDLPQIPVVWDTTLDVRARFVIRDGLPSAIAVKAGAAGVGIELIHEVGHFLDFSAIDRFGAFASDASPRMGRWLTAVFRTPTYRALSTVVDRANSQRPLVDRHHWERIEALRFADELWARTYTQYVVRRSGRPDLVVSLSADRFGTIAGFEFPLHWGQREFEPIDQEIERLFRRLRWRRR